MKNNTILNKEKKVTVLETLSFIIRLCPFLFFTRVAELIIGIVGFFYLAGGNSFIFGIVLLGFWGLVYGNVLIIKSFGVTAYGDFETFKSICKFISMSVLTISLFLIFIGICFKLIKQYEENKDN